MKIKMKIKLFFASSLVFLFLFSSFSYSFQYSEIDIPYKVHQFRKINGSNGTYNVAKNLDIARQFLKLDTRWIKSQYLEYCRRLNIIPINIENSQVTTPKDINQLLTAYDFYINEPEIKKEYRHQFFKHIQYELYRKKNLRKKFTELFNKNGKFITSTIDYVKYYTRDQHPNISFNHITNLLLEYTEIKDIFKENSYYPEYCIQDTSFIFFYVQHLKRNSPKDYTKVTTGLRRRGLFTYRQFLSIMDIYTEAELWLYKALEFFQKEQWFFDPSRKRFYSLEDLVFNYWNFFPVEIPDIRINITNNGTPKITEKYLTDISWANQIFRGLNEKSKNYIKTYDSEMKFFLIKDTKFTDDDEAILMEKGKIEKDNPDIMIVNGNTQIPDTLNTRIAISYDLSTTIEKFLTNFPSIVNHLMINCFIKTWQEIRTENHEEIFFKADSCVIEGISELSKYIFLRKLFQLYPYLIHNQQTKFYLFSNLTKYENGMTGFFWMKTIYDLTGRTFRGTFNLAQNHNFNLDSLLISPELAKAAIKYSKDTTIITKNRSYPSRPLFSILPYMEILLVNKVPIIKKIEYHKLKN